MQDFSEEKSIKLSDIKKGEHAIISGFTAMGEVRKRLIDMGLVRGCSFEVVRKAPLGDPIEIKVNGFLLSLRLEEARHIIVSTKT